MREPVTPQELNLYELWRVAGLLVGFQITVLGWRINREMKILEAKAESGRKIWFPIADYLNLLSIAFTVVFVFVLPVLRQLPRFRLWAFGVALLLFAGFPFALVGHYEIFTPRIRPEDPEYFPRQEKAVAAVTGLAVILFSCWFWHTRS